MTSVGVLGVGLWGDGLAGWSDAQAVLRGEAPWTANPVAAPPPILLAATERRRTGPVARLALEVARQAAEGSGHAPGSLRAVFGSSNGDGVTVSAILDQLNRPDGFVSPTQFHNSVHNAAAGYWSIATGSRAPATVLGCHDATFGTALLAAAAEAVTERAPVLLAVYDVPLPAPLDAKRPMAAAFGAALVLAPGDTLHLAWSADPAPDTPPREAALARLALGNPAARSLRLLESLARRAADRLALSCLDGHVAVEVRPWT